MSAEIVSVGPDSVARIAQLTQKTNQFNMTTRRYSESEVLSLNERANWQLFGIRIVDRFGDNGIVGVVFLHILDDIVDIDTFLLSCRVIGRTVETAMLAYCEEIARSAGCKRIRGWFLQTRKNDPASQVYCNHRFECVERSESGILWELNLTDNSIASPEWIAKQFV
jgi:FkbH-like protein